MKLLSENVQPFIPVNVSKLEDCETSNLYQLYLQRTIPEPIYDKAFRVVKFQCKFFLEEVLFSLHERASAPIVKTLMQELIEAKMDSKTFINRLASRTPCGLNPKVAASFEKYFPHVQQALHTEKMSINGLYLPFNCTSDEWRMKLKLIIGPRNRALSEMIDLGNGKRARSCSWS